MKARSKTMKSKNRTEALPTTRTQALDVQTGTSKLKIGLADMLKGGVIMDVTNAEQAIAEDAGRCQSWRWSVPADIRAQGGVARMASIRKIKEIMAVGHHPGHGQVRIGHFAEAQILEVTIISTRARCSHPPMRRITSTSSPSRCRLSAAHATSLRRFGVSAKVPR